MVTDRHSIKPYLQLSSYDEELDLVSYQKKVLVGLETTPSVNKALALWKCPRHLN